MGELPGNLSQHDAARVGQIETRVETVDKRLDRISFELRDLKLLANEAATKRDIARLVRGVRGSVATWWIALALVIGYLAAGQPDLAALLRSWMR